MNTNCPKCHSEYPYQDGNLWICPECANEWTLSAEQNDLSLEAETKIVDSNGNELKDGDSVSVIKELKIKGASSSIKSGTKVKNIKLILDSSDGHNIACRIDGIGSINLKSEFVKKA